MGSVDNFPCCNPSTNAANTSWYSGSPVAPDSFVRSNTEIVSTVLGKAFMKCDTEKGRYKRTCMTPVFSPALFKAFTVSATVSPPEPMITVICFASLAPLYSNSSYFLPVIFSNALITSSTIPGVLS